MAEQTSSLIDRLNRRQLIKRMFLGGAALAVGAPFVIKKSQSASKMFHQRQRFMGTWVAVTAFSDEESKAMAAISDAFAEMREVDRLMSIHREDSQLSEINRKAGNDSVNVDVRVLEVFQHAKAVAAKSDGFYDPTILPLMNLFGFYGHARASYPADREIHRTLELVGWKDLELNELTSTVGLRRRGSALDLGSIGKGYALDRAVMALRKHGIESALVDAGGNLFALGAPYGDPDPRAGWTVGIRNPRSQGSSSPSYLRTLVLRDRAVATSGVDQNVVKIGKTEIGHIFNAVTGRPVHEFLSCSPVTQTGLASDVLSTAGYILGKAKASTIFGSEAEWYFYS